MTMNANQAEWYKTALIASLKLLASYDPKGVDLREQGRVVSAVDALINVDPPRSGAIARQAMAEAEIAPPPDLASEDNRN